MNRIRKEKQKDVLTVLDANISNQYILPIYVVVLDVVTYYVFVMIIWFFRIT